MKFFAPARFALLLPGLCLASNGFAAQTLELDPSVITGSRSASPSFDLPYSVDSISQQQISDGQLGINASEVLSRVPGLVVQNRQNYAQDLQISSRGFGARSAFGVRGIKLIADGIPASTPDGQGQAATFNLDTAERIEVLRGPAATLYGSNAGGVIQMFSRDGEGPPRIGAETLIGSDGLSKNHLTAEGATDDIGFVLDASRMDTDGYRDHSAARRDQTFAKLNLHPDDDSKLALIYSSLEQNGTQDPLGQTWEAYKADPRSVTPAALTYNTRKSIDHQQLGMNYERYIGDATLQVNAYTGTRSVIQYLAIPKGTPSNEQGGGVVQFDRKFYGASLRWLQPVDGVPGELTLIGGLDFDQSQDSRHGYNNYIGDQLGVKGAMVRDEVDTARSLDPYVQANWAIDDWTVQAGLRYSTMEMDVDDQFLSNGDDSGTKRYEKATPSVSVMYAFTPDLHGYVSAGKGFETPTQAELAYSPGGNGFNFGLKPSESTQYEMGLKAQIDNTRINAAIFQITTEDELVVLSNTGGRTTYQNAGRTLRRGFELGVESQLSEQWTTTLAYTRLQATYDSDFASTKGTIDKGNYLPGVPQTTLFAEVNWKPTDWVSTAIEGMYRSKVYVEDTNTAKAAPAYSVFNWRAKFEQKVEHWTFHQTLRLDNLLDRQYVGSVIVADGNSRYYGELRNLGLPVDHIDVGGGLGVDYDGTHSRNASSINYDMDDYAGVVVGMLKEFCDAQNLPHPNIFSESGRSLTAHHAMLVVQVTDVEKHNDDVPVIENKDILPETVQWLVDLLGPTDIEMVTETYWRATHYMSDIAAQYADGKITLAEKALAEQCYFAVCRRLHNSLKARQRSHRQVLDELNDKLADKYICNFSVFQSLPDTWAIGQVLPILPLHRLDEEPMRRAVLQDLTCDSDGKIKQYVDEQSIETSLPVHGLNEGEDYLLGIFLVGAYQEILGDMHNLFGDTDSVNIYQNDDGSVYHAGIETHDTIEDMLRYVHLSPEELMNHYRDKVASANISAKERTQYLDALRLGLTRSSYLSSH